MRLFTSTLILACTIFFSFYPKAQVAIGEWRDHLPYTRSISVADAGNKIYSATEYSLFYFDNDDRSINRLSKVNGLSDIGISTISYSYEYDALLIAYTNTNIDLLKDGEIINISDIKRKQILGKKIINNIYFKDSLAYLACGFGIVVLDVKNEEFPEPIYYIGSSGSQIDVLDVAIGKDTLYAATEAGIYKAPINSPNLADFNVWTIDSRLHPQAKFNAINYYHDKLIANYSTPEYNGDTVFMYDYSINKWQEFPDVSSSTKFNILTSHDNLLIVGQGKVYIYNSSYELVTAIYNLNGNPINAKDATLDGDGAKWIADYKGGLVKTEDNFNGDFIRPNGPYAANVFDMSLQNEELWVAAGGRTSGWGKIYLRDGVYTFSNESWTSFNSANDSPGFDTINDFVCVVVDPNKIGHTYVGTWMQGVMEFMDGEVVNVFNDKNSSLQKWPAADYVAVSGVAFDSYNNLWVVNSRAANPLAVKTVDGQWKSFSLGSTLSDTDYGKMVIDSYNQKWIMLRTDNKLVVFTDNNTIDNPTDDITKILSNASGNGALPGIKIYSIAQDLDGEIWLGSDEGIGVIYSPGKVFTGSPGDYDAQRILVEVGGYTQYLLESEVVTAITIDGDNRKWVGTERAGVFLLSADGTEEIEHFTEENSPLYSNQIVDIEINNETGEVFFGTNQGIISYKSTATSGGPVNSDVVVYPNPVKPGYAGVIAIKGLVSNADIKITDVSGNLIYATRAEGGQAIWSGKSFDGRKASTGVYLVFATDDEGNEKIVTKILFIN